MDNQELIDVLGYKAKDKVTGFAGVIGSVSFDLYGCVQVLMSPAAKGGKIEDSRWFDFARLSIDRSKRVMPLPDFSHVKGPAEKPASAI